MTQTKKFSQFNGPDPIQSTDIVVGLRVGPNGLDNWQFTGVGSGGGGGGVTETITQPGQTFVAGNWVRIDVATAVYVLAQADTTSDAEVIGVVISSNIPAGTFVLQQSGYITTAQAVVSGLTTGVPQFLSTSSPGAMQPMDVTVDGQISRAVFVPDSATSGWVLPYRGIITDGGPNTGTSSPTPGGSDSNIITVTQNGHPFNPGDVVYVIAPVAGQATYDFAKADNFATSQAVGVVIEVLNANQFMLQFSGYNLQSGSVGGITVDDMGFPIVASTVYYLSSTSAGKVTSVKPTAAGTFSRPVFVSERTVLTSTLYAGWILPQKPTDSVITVAEGGTGDGTFTPNTVVGAGSTSTSPLISIGPGAVGQVLTSNGPLLPSTFQAVGGSSANVFLGYLNAANNFSDANIFTNNGGPFNSYFILVERGNNLVVYGINGTSAGPNVSVGFQFYMNGAWSTGFTYGVIGGGYKTVSNTGVATAWGMAYTGSPPHTADSLYILPPTSRNVSLNSGYGYITTGGAYVGMNFNMFASDYSNLPVSATAYSSVGFADDAYTGPVTGLRIFFDNGVLTPGSGARIAVYGIPNA